MGGTAGRSAANEYARRCSRREVQTKAKWGDRLGSVVLALTDEPATTRAWSTGSAGEARVGRILDSLADVRTLHDRAIPGTQGNIDHLVVGPAGVFVVDAKNLKGMIRVRDRGGLFRSMLRLYVGRRDCSELADKVLWQAQFVEVALDAADADRSIGVTPVLCFADGDWPLLFPPSQFRGVRLEGERSIKRLVSNPIELDTVSINAIVRFLADAFPPR